MVQSSVHGILFIIFFINTINQIVAEIHLKIEDVDVIYVNGEYIDEDTFDLSVNYINTTYNSLRCKINVLKKFPEDSRATLKMYGYAFGNYRVPMGINIDVSICDVKTKPLFMVPFITAIGGDVDKCGPEVGEYGNENFFPANTALLPNLFPSNKYRFDAEVANKDIKIVTMQIFFTV